MTLLPRLPYTILHGASERASPIPHPSGVIAAQYKASCVVRPADVVESSEHIRAWPDTTNLPCLLLIPLVDDDIDADFVAGG